MAVDGITYGKLLVCVCARDCVVVKGTRFTATNSNLLFFHFVVQNGHGNCLGIGNCHWTNFGVGKGHIKKDHAPGAD